MATATGNTAAAPAMPMPAGTLPDDFQARLTRYKTSTAVFRGMVTNGILNESDYEKSRDILANKYGLSLCSIFR